MNREKRTNKLVSKVPRPYTHGLRLVITLTSQDYMKGGIREACKKIERELLNAISSFPKQIRKRLKVNGR